MILWIWHIHAYILTSGLKLIEKSQLVEWKTLMGVVLYYSTINLQAVTEGTKQGLLV